ncbi:1-(5-phosphoribosyl)-5-[(5-phosphoribosylamino)methylideneamino]imidazole-4-carboxamide isomerase [Gilvibacter sp.]|uniref:1-(5-phosphoribosyl)-5-[(5- phosphoribosylamino)methylideneamino]imidazole-4- carboxamide isomerase n=1 Tax=Gilvibacter sp. TaxID=2729997 RepID=UPI0025B9668A|nr:1-(5-phosphoribosyl)-5-[(5-phosphoribosylamino)methylideneamino]imidazole-4-carboxamide isomerase [Gilvibacter sp.]NQX76122.1 1-(5-phosphoribosyl)-5-[(5-phosphoribosylamino)methylideneamino]imidazole-4-carboxamide isomerase [Gilvibacter sp.]
MRIIPAIDLIEGKCVRLTQGDYNQKTIYNEDPLEVAKEFEAHGIQYLHLVDLDGAKSKQIVNHKVLERIATKTSLKIDFGGGVKSDEDIRIAFESGAQQVTGGSIAVSAPELLSSWLKRYGSERLILGADCKDRMIATHGWQQASSLEVTEFISQYLKQGAQYVICTDIAKDGMLQGPSFELYRELLELEDIKLIASGGVTTLSELEQLQAMGCEGAIVGKAIYEGTIALKDLEKLC